MTTNASGTAHMDGRPDPYRIGWLLAGLLWLPCFPGVEASNSAVLEIGNRKQLFLDRHVVESLTHAKRVLNPAAKHPANPLVKPDRPWEGHYLGLGRVLYDEDRKIFRMWYGSTDRFAAKKGGDRLRPYRWDWSVEDGRAVRRKVEEIYGYSEYAGRNDWIRLYAESKDGIHWTKPNLGLVEFQGSRDNNMLPPGEYVPGHYDPHEPDPDKRYKKVVLRESSIAPKNAPGLYAWDGVQVDFFHSPDGIKWTPYPGNPRTVGEGDPWWVRRWGGFVGNWDPIGQHYVQYQENCLHRYCPLGIRVIGRAQSPDMIHWTEMETILVPDQDDDPDTEFYGMPVFYYEGFRIGLLWIFRTTNTLHYPQLAVSRDGVRYEREFREPLIRVGDYGDFDESTVYVRAPLVHDGQIRIYYYGGNWRGPEALHAKADRAIFAVGLATLPEDGFVSVDSGKIRPGELVTRPLRFRGRELVVNMEAAKHNHGSGQPQVRVELLGVSHEPIEGFLLRESDPVATSGRHVMSWQGRNDVSRLAGQTVRVRFSMKNAKLYSFRFR